MKGRKMVGEIIIPMLAGCLCFYVLKIVGRSGLVPLCGACRDYLIKTIDNIPFNLEMTAPLVKALLIGDKNSLSTEVKSIFRESGASHLLALSGLHLGFIYSIVRRITSVFGNYPPARAARAVITISFSIFYAIMTGASPSIVRAMLFIVIRETAALDPEREIKGIRVLACSLLIQTIANPESALSPGFQLSYLAMCGIFLIGQPLQKWYPESSKFDPMKRIWNAASISIACQIFTAPLAWHYFHSFPVHFLLTNIMALPVTELALALAIPTLLFCALGICPQALSDLCETAFQVLVFILETISSLD